MDTNPQQAGPVATGPQPAAKASSRRSRAGAGEAGPSAAGGAATSDQVRNVSRLRRFLLRPEMGSLLGAVLVFLIFWTVAEPIRSLHAFSTVLYASSTIGIMVVGVGLLMIGGEFDLSTGVGVITGALSASIFTYQLSLNVWAGVIFSLAVMLLVGFVNGFLVTMTKIHSFLITLGMMLMLFGLNLTVTKLITGQVATSSISDMDGFALGEKIFASTIDIGGMPVRITVLWWLLFVAIATWVLLRTKVGNWIYAAGGDPEAARAVGVPVTATKIGLFMTVGFCAWFSGMHLLFAFDTVQSGGGITNELIYIVAAVIGGCLLTGGYGTAIGAAIGAFIYGMTTQGIVFAGWDSNLVKFFLGVMLLLAVMMNMWVRRQAEKG
jgi:simple sugar transport system permease protein